MTVLEISQAAKAEDIRTLYADRGAFRFRGMVSPDEVDTLRSIVENCFAHAETGADIDVREGVKRGYVSWPRIDQWLALEQRSLLQAVVDRVHDTVAIAMDQTRVQLLVGFSNCRRHRRTPVSGEQTQVTWHRDATFVALGGFPVASNVWIPLDEVGISAPSIDLIPGSHRIMRGVRDETPGGTNIADEWVAEHLGQFKKWTPHCRRGDVLVFDTELVHRTQRLPQPATTDRMNFEFRWAPA